MLPLVARLVLLGLLLSCARTPAATQEARKWTDKSGSFSVDATFVSLADGQVTLRGTDGVEIEVPLESLNAGDQAWIKTKLFGTSTPDPGSMTTAPFSPPESAPGGVIASFSDLSWGLSALAFSPNGRYVLAGKPDRAIMIFDLKHQARVNLTDKLEQLGGIQVVDYTRDGTRVLAAGDKGRVSVWKVENGGILLEASKFTGHSQAVTALAVASSSEIAASASRSKDIAIWTVEDGRSRARVTSMAQPVTSLRFTPDGRTLVAANSYGLGNIDVATGRAVSSSRLAGASGQSAISADARFVAATDGYKFGVWERSTMRQLMQADTGSVVWAVAFSPGGRFVATGDRQRVGVWEVARGEKVTEFDLPDGGYVKSFRFSNDGRMLAAIGSNSGATLRVFQVLPAFVDPRKAD